MFVGGSLMVLGLRISIPMESISVLSREYAIAFHIDINPLFPCGFDSTVLFNLLRSIENDYPRPLCDEGSLR